MDNVVHIFAFVCFSSLCIPPEIKDPEGCKKTTTRKENVFSMGVCSRAAFRQLQIQIHAIKDRYHNAKSVTIPLPTLVRQTIGALLSDRKPGRNICFCEYIVSQ